MREAKNRAKVQENEIEILKLELQSRPSVKELRESQMRTKKLQSIVRKQKELSSSSGGNDTSRYSSSGGGRYSGHVDDIEGLPAQHCRTMLKVHHN